MNTMKKDNTFFNDIYLLKTKNNLINQDQIDSMPKYDESSYSPLISKEVYSIQNYLSHSNPLLFNQDKDILIKKQNELIALKTILEKQNQQNLDLYNMEKEYCNHMIDINKQLLNKVKELSDENNRLIYERKKMQKNCEVMEKEINFSLLSIINTPRKEPQADRVFNPPKVEVVKEPEIIKEEEEPEPEVFTELEEKKKRYRITKEKIAKLNMNHNFGKLDEIRLKNLQEQLQKEKEEIELMEKERKKRLKAERPIVFNSTVIVEEKENSNWKGQKKVKKIKEQKVTLHKMQTMAPNSKNKKQDKENDIVLEDLDSKNIPVKDKEKVLQIAIRKIEDYAKKCDEGTIIYKESHLDTPEFMGDIRRLYEDLKNGNDDDLNFDLFPMLIFEIIKSNYNSNLNQLKLKEKTEYNEEDFDFDLDEDYQEIFAQSLSHLKKMLKGNHITLDLAVSFLSQAIVNFESNKLVIERVMNVIREKMKK